jgi:acid phosphatase
MLNRQALAALAAVAVVAIAGAGVALADQPDRTHPAPAPAAAPAPAPQVVPEPAAPPKAPPAAGVAAAVPRPDHVVIVIFENKPVSSIIGSSNAPYINSLANQGATMTQSFALTHPSQPNYIQLFSGSAQGVTSDACPKNFTGRANLGRQLINAGLSFKGYSEGMPSDGYTGCTSGRYARKHNPWVDFDNVPAASNLRFSRFPTDFTTLPTASIVVPDLCNDMHDCSVSTGDTWLRNHLDAYAQWAKTHNSLLIVTFDEDDHSASNHIATVFFGQHVKPGKYSERITHYTVLRTIEDAYALAPINNAATATPITDIWQ